MDTRLIGGYTNAVLGLFSEIQVDETTGVRSDERRFTVRAGRKPLGAYTLRSDGECIVRSDHPRFAGTTGDGPYDAIRMLAETHGLDHIGDLARDAVRFDRLMRAHEPGISSHDA